MPRYHNRDGVRVQFTPEEETARDADEAQVEIDKAAYAVQAARTAVLRAKLDDETITFAELVELSKGKL